jgi:hypothetical protein
MSASRWALSLFFIGHLSSIGLASLPQAARPAAVGPARHPLDDSIAGILTPVVDRGAKIVAGFAATCLAATRPLRRFTAVYVKVTGLGQIWNMFSSPWTENRYARLRYYVAPSQAANVQNTRPAWMATEMVFPELREENRVHLVRSYRAAARDKAFLAAVEAASRKPSLTGLPPDLAPVVRYFANRYRRDHLAAGERIVRTEVWLGTSPVRSRGSSGDRQTQEARRRALIEAYDGPFEEVVERDTYPPIHATEMQEDIVWQLEFFEE